jgi:hypothetical protein
MSAENQVISPRREITRDERGDLPEEKKLPAACGKKAS